MSERNPLFSRLDPEAERRRALAKVYALLVRLADEFEESSVTPEPSTDEEKVAEPTFVPLNF